MFPSQLFALFPPFPRAHRVFVAISFADQFAHRWSEVIAPAIAAVEIDGRELEPHRVDTRLVNDSILTEILDGVSTDRLVFADVTAIGSMGDYTVRNGNVLYEVGLAHAVRLPEEVLLFRSDNEHLPFDVASIRISSYDPDGNPVKARADVSSAIANAIREVDLRRLRAVETAVQSLGFEGFIFLAKSAEREGLEQPVIRTMRDVMSNMGLRLAIPRLLDLGLITSVFAQLTSEVAQNLDGPAERMIGYKITPFGNAVLLRSAELLEITAATREKIQAAVEQA